MPTTIESLQKIIDNGDQAWAFIRDKTNEPHATKVARNFSTADVAQLIGRSESSIRMAEKRGAIPTAGRDSRNHRAYTLNQISEIRDALGIKVGRKEGDQACVVSVITYKGGVGKTTEAASLSQYLTLRGYKVLAIDADPQASLTSYHGIIPDRDIDIKDTIYSVLLPEGGEDHGQRNLLSQNMASIVRDTHWGDMKLVPSNLELYNAEYLLPMEAARLPANQRMGFANRLLDAIKTVEKDYDVIVIDAPPSLGMISMNVVNASDGIVAPMQPAIIDFASTQQFLGMVLELLERFQSKSLSFYRVLINNYRKHPSTDQVVNLIRMVYGDYCLNAAMGRTQEINNAGMRLQTVYELDGPTSDSKTYRRAITMMNTVNHEIEGLIKGTWPSHAKDADQE